MHLHAHLVLLKLQALVSISDSLTVQHKKLESGGWGCGGTTLVSRFVRQFI